jgi:hypothetical protein
MKNNYDALFTYYPKRFNVNDENSKRILQFKDNKTEAFSYYFRILKRYFEIYTGIEAFTLCCVPNSKINKQNAIVSLINSLCDVNSYLDNGTELIKCVKSRASFCSTKIRNVKYFIDSIYISDNVINKKIVLLDDVTTTGLSFMTLETILLNKGADSVDCLALAKSYHID